MIQSDPLYQSDGTTIVHLFGSVGILSGSLSLLIFRLKNPAISLYMSRIFAVAACVGVMTLAPILKGTRSSGGALTTVTPITSVLDNVSFT